MAAWINCSRFSLSRNFLIFLTSLLILYPCDTIELTCLLKFKFSSNQTPTFFTSFENRMHWSPINTPFIKTRLFKEGGLNRIISVLSGLIFMKCRLLHLIIASIHLGISLCKTWNWNESANFLRPFESSANDDVENKNSLKTYGCDLTFIPNRQGPIIEPCGTPYRTSFSFWSSKTGNL